MIRSLIEVHDNFRQKITLEPDTSNIEQLWEYRLPDIKNLLIDTNLIEI